MIDHASYLKGVAIGIAVAAPVGPMSVLAMRRTLVRGWGAGFRTGLGIACGDASYALAAVLGLASVAHFMLAYDRQLHFIAGAFLIYLGLRAIRRPTNDAVAAPPTLSSSAATDFGGALLLTLTNPSTIVSFAAIFTVLAPSGHERVDGSLATVVGVFSGSALWWFALTAGIATLRHAIGRRVRRGIDVVSGTMLAAFGVADVRRAL